MIVISEMYHASNVVAAKTVVVDNGGGFVKAGYSTESAPRFFHNAKAVSRANKSYFIGDGIDTCPNPESLYIKRAFEKGYCVNWDVEKDVWARVMQDVLHVVPSETTLIISEPVFNPTLLREYMDQLVFEEFGFHSYACCLAPSLAARSFSSSHPESVLARTGLSYGIVVDAGFSYTHVVPFVLGQPQTNCIRRIDVGGKLLTNYLKETISFRHWNMMDEYCSAYLFHRRPSCSRNTLYMYLLVNDIKEKTCTVSLDFCADLKLAKQTEFLKLQYVLPSGGGTSRFGSVRPAATAASKDDQILNLCNERICVPELLFNPSDIGLRQMGIAETIADIINKMDAASAAACLRNIVCCGGTSSIPNFSQRLLRDVRAMVPQAFEVNVIQMDNPASAAWLGGAELATTTTMQQIVVSRAEYEEKGHIACRQKMHQL